MAMIIADSSMERARDYESQDQSRLFLARYVAPSITSW